MPDLGEGTVDAEIVAWHTKPGDVVSEDQLIVEVMTDKAAVEVPAPVSGRVVSITGAPGDKVAVGSPLIVFDLSGDAPAATPAAAPAAKAAAAGQSVATATAIATGAVAPAATADPPVPAARHGRVMASPANRRRAREAGIDLTTVVGSGPGGRILRDDLGAARDAAMPATAMPAAAAPAAAARSATASVATGTTADVTGTSADTAEIKVIGLRRLIAERMSEANRTIPHLANVEEIDFTEKE
jgi:2-oxoisovalerate dehydrogenase E2 component (dihydrolipoyl transacylase)